MDGSPLTFIVKTSFDCNLRCSYCYEGHRPNIGRMPMHTVDNLILKAAKHASDANTHITFVWHGGEPLLLGIDFYKYVREVQKKSASASRFRNMLQTNGMLLDKEYARFFVKNGFKVGISLDGPEEIHDAQRLTKAGCGSFKSASSALTMMRKQKADTGAVAIFTRNTLDHIDAFYDFFRDQNVSVRLNPLLVLGNASDSLAKSLHVSPKEYGESLIYLFDRWIGEPKYSFVFDPFFNAVRSVIGGNTYSCVFAGKCHNFFKIFPEGDVYLCGKHDKSDDAIGNINADNLNTVLSSVERKKYAFDKACVHETCRACEHVKICHGGCTSASQFPDGGVLGRDYYCESYKMIFDHIKKYVPKSLIMPSAENNGPRYIL